MKNKPIFIGPLAIRIGPIINVETIVAIKYADEDLEDPLRTYDIYFSLNNGTCREWKYPSDSARKLDWDHLTKTLTVKRKN